MSVYGYPREPEETGDELPPGDLPSRVSSHPVSVPAGPPSPAAAPPQPLLPADPPGAGYTSLADIIPVQRPAPGFGHAPAPVPDAAPPNGSRPGRHAGDELGAEPGFDWLRHADRPEVPVEPSLPGFPPVDPAPQGFRSVEPSPPAPPPQFRPVDPAGAAPAVERPDFGPMPSMGQPVPISAPPAPAPPPVTSAPPAWAAPPVTSAPPASASPAYSSAVPVPTTERPAFGPSPSMGQPAIPPAVPPTPGAMTPAPPMSQTPSPPEPAIPARPTVTRPAPVRPAFSDEPDIPPWDRRPLLIVIAATAVLVLIGVISGVITAALATAPIATWREPGSSSTPDPGASPTSEAPAAPPAAAAETITLSGVGDVIMGSANLGTPPNDGSGFFDGVRDALAADLVMGNLDMTLSDPTGYSKCSPGATDCFQLSLPPSYAGVLRDGGFQLMTLANNHTYDMGEQGFANTAAALQSAGIEHTGGVDQITYVTVKGTTVAVLGFSVYSYTANLNDLDRAADLVQEAASQAEVVVVQMQGGAEGSDQTSVPPAGTHESFAGEDRGDLRGFAHTVIDAGADLVIGHGPHVMRGMEFYQGRLIAYSLGNFCGYAVLSSAGWSGVGGILSVTLQRDGTWAGGRLVATEMVGPGSPAVDAELRALAFVDDLSVQDFGGSAARIDHATGTITAP